MWGMGGGGLKVADMVHVKANADLTHHLSPKYPRRMLPTPHSHPAENLPPCPHPSHRTTMRLPLACLALLATLATAHADCQGHNLIAALPPGDLAALKSATDAQPFAHGNLWHATRGTEDITLIGTYHLDDPRHAATVAALTPALQKATALLVEAGPTEEAQLKDLMTREPQRMLITTGPTIPEALPPADWHRLSAALNARGIPAFMAAKMKPVFLTAILSIPACNFAAATAAAENGLDKRLIAVATAQGLPVHGLEPYDTIFGIFDQFTTADQLILLTQTLDSDGGSDDMSQTLTDAYFAGDARLFWQFSYQQSLSLPGMTKAEADREFALVETALMNTRNTNWIPVIEAAAAKGPIVVAFGALHLSGDKGVLNLLQQDGYQITPIPAP